MGNVILFARAGRLLSPAEAGKRKLKRAHKQYHIAGKALRAAEI